MQENKFKFTVHLLKILAVFPQFDTNISQILTTTI